MSEKFQIAVNGGRESLEMERQRYKYFGLTAENRKVSQKVFLYVILILNVKHFGLNMI